MKLTTIRMINSGNYSIANLQLDASSIQIAGRNNKGKTSLLWTLLFLFVVDRKKTTHKDYGSEESLKFYFKNQKSSYIIFEGFDEKQGYFYMLLKRDGSKIKYYFVKKQFKTEFLISENNQVKEFTEVLENPNTGLEKPLKDISAILARVITSKKDEVGFLRLEDNISSKRFGELYKHLFEIGNNSSDILKDGILVSFGLTNEKIDFAKEIGNEQIAKWKREFIEITNLKVANQKYGEIKEKKRIYENKKVKLRSLAIAYEEIDFDASMKVIETKKIELTTELNDENIELGEKDKKLGGIRRDKETANRDKGIKEFEQTKITKEIELINSYMQKNWIEQEIRNIEDNKSKLEQVLQKMDVVKSKKEAENKLKNLKFQDQGVKKYIDNSSNLLLLNISNNKDDISLINALLSDEVKNLPKEAIIKPLSEQENESIFSFNDAQIDISQIERKEIPTKKEKEFEKRELEKEIKLWESTLEAIDDKSNKEVELQKLKDEIFELQTKLTKINNLSKLKETVALLDIEIKKYNDEYIKLKKRLEEELKSKSKLADNIIILGNKLSYLDDLKQDIFNFKILYSEIRKKINLKEKTNQPLSVEELEKLYQNNYKELEEALAEVNNRYSSYLELIDLTRKDLRGMEDAYIEENKFLEWLENRCYGIDITEKELKRMTLAKKDLLSHRIKNFIKKLDDVRTYINNTNRLIANYTISDLSKVKIELLENKKQLSILSEISNSEKDLFTILEEENKGMEDVFLDYIHKEKIIKLSELFSIKLNREKAGRKETSKQSNGTEKMLRVMLLLILMRGMINKEDTIPFLIDEVADIDDKNQAELLNFFKQLNLLPISASPNTSHEFEKIYHIEEINGKSYLNHETSTRKVFNE